MTHLLASADWMQGGAMLLVGFVAGTLGGLLGIGGGIVMIPAMVLILGDLFGENSFHVYKLAAIATSMVLSIPAVTQHARARAIVFPTHVGIVPLAVVGVVGGVALGALFEDEHAHVLRRVFGVFLLLVVAFNAWQQRGNTSPERSTRDRCPVARRRGLFGLAVGLPAGLIAGLLGVGGGVWAVPMQHLGLGVRVRNAIANSAFMILFVAPTTAVVQSIAIVGMAGIRPLDGWYLAAWLAPGALLGGWCGAGLTHRWPVRWVRLAFHILLAVTGLRLALV